MTKKSKSGNTQNVNNVKDTTPYVFQREKIHFDLNIKELPWTQKQKEIINLFLSKETKIMFLKGPAGSSKTTLAMYCGLQLLNTKKVSDMVLVRSAVESADSKLGYLPGDIQSKFEVYLAPFNDKFSELINVAQIKKLENDNRITICPINFARGLHFSVKFICCDEAQNLTTKELQTLLTRTGEFCKVIICGDPEQSDLPKDKSGFNKVYDCFNNTEAQNLGIQCVELSEQDIVRSEICRYIVNKFKVINNSHTTENKQHDKKHEQTTINNVVESWSPRTIHAHENNQNTPGTDIHEQRV
jgi:phosphate starvation-inducible protein PhoH